MANERIIVRTMKELNDLTKKYRELENNDKFVMIIKKA